VFAAEAGGDGAFFEGVVDRVSITAHISTNNSLPAMHCLFRLDGGGGVLTAAEKTVPATPTCPASSQ
jgi:hypothetical protein